MDNPVINNPSRRKFVRAVLAAVVLGLTLADASVLTSMAAAQGQSAAEPAAPEGIEQRIVRADASKYQHLTAVHGGPGSMEFRVMLGTDTVKPNLIFFHRGVINPKSGIGQHFHNKCEEMFVILDGEAEFTVNGRTTLIKGPAGVPDRMGDAHGIIPPINPFSG